MPSTRDLSQLSSLLAFRNRPEGVAEGVPIEPTPTIKTNWSIAPANDNVPPQGGAGVEMAVEIIPSVDEIMRQVDHGDVEYGAHIDENGKSHKVVVRIGKLRFSDGSQVEKMFKLVRGSVVETSVRMPVGAMLCCRERSAREKGPVEDEGQSNEHYMWMLGYPARPRKIRLTPQKGKRVNLSKSEAAQMLASAIANTVVMPTVKKYADGLPVGPAKLSSLFIGGRKGKNGESGSQAWEDMFDQREERDRYNLALDSMRRDDVEILTAAMSAKSLKQLGEIRGFKGQYAVEAGRRLLIAANENFENAVILAKTATT